MLKLWTSVIVIVVIAAGIAFTGSGHRFLSTFGFTAACGGSDGCND